MTETIGERLYRLRARSGLTLAQIAKGAGYKGPSSVQAFFSHDYDHPALDRALAIRLSHALAGHGEPPIKVDEILELADITADQVERYSPRVQRDIDHNREAPPAPTPTPTLRGQPRDVPVYGTALAADLNFDAEGIGPEPVEITNFSMGETITYVRRPPGLDGRDRVYAIFVSGSSMEPRYRPGDPVFVDPLRPPAIGDDVIVQLPANDGSGDIVTGLIKTLVKRTSSFLELEQYSPAIRFRVPSTSIAHIHRVIPWREAFGM